MITAALCRRPMIQALLLAALLGVAGCAGAPVQEMSNARQALQAAAESGVVTSSSDAYREAEKLLRSAEQKLENRSYRSARHDAVKAKALAISAMESTVSTDSLKDNR